MAVRNSYVTVHADGRATAGGIGPAARDGGMTIRYQVRDNGAPFEAVTIAQYVDSIGGIVTELELHGDWRNVTADAGMTGTYRLRTVR